MSFLPQDGSMRTWKVRVTLSMEVDRHAWYLTYGRGATAKDLREDVQSYILEQVQGSAATDEGCILSTKVSS